MILQIFESAKIWRYKKVWQGRLAQLVGIGRISAWSRLLSICLQRKISSCIFYLYSLSLFLCQFFLLFPYPSVSIIFLVSFLLLICLYGQMYICVSKWVTMSPNEPKLDNWIRINLNCSKWVHISQHVYSLRGEVLHSFSLYSICQQVSVARLAAEK